MFYLKAVLFIFFIVERLELIDRELVKFIEILPPLIAAAPPEVPAGGWADSRERRPVRL